MLQIMDSKVNSVEEKLNAVAESVKSLNLPDEKLGKIVANFLTNCKPIGGKKSKRQCPPRKKVDTSTPTSTLLPSVEARPEVKVWGEILKNMIGFTARDIPPQALSYAFECLESPDKRPAVLLRSLMRRMEHCLGVGDALRDATTAAKINGCITDHAWENFIRPFFLKVQNLLNFEESLTESASDANDRRERMVPYVKFVTWFIAKSKEYPTGRSILTTVLRPQLAEFVRSNCLLTGLLAHLFYHDLDGTATDVRQDAKLTISWIIDATVIGKSRLGNKNRILHHTRGGFKLIVNGRASRSPYSIDEFLLMTGNDHFEEV